MALVMKMDINKFKEILPEFMVAKLETLLSADGSKLDLGFYSITLSKDAKHYSTKIAISTTSLMKDTAPQPAVSSALAKIDDLLDEALNGWGIDVPASKLETGKSYDLDFSAEADSTFIPVDKKVPDKPKTKKKVADVIPQGPVKLRVASQLGQQVTGTSSDSTYRAVALSERLNVAVRLHSSNVSIRAEGVPNAYEAGRLSSLGFSKATGGHWSIHMECNGIPASRIVGAILMDLGVDFELQIKTLKEASL